MITAWQTTQSLRAWGRDPRCQVSTESLRRRLAAGWPPEKAISAPPRPGRLSQFVRVRIPTELAEQLLAPLGTSEDLDGIVVQILEKYLASEVF
jgi:hypothetical protein